VISIIRVKLKPKKKAAHVSSAELENLSGEGTIQRWKIHNCAVEPWSRHWA
jgi:hypothetical protein